MKAPAGYLGGGGLAAVDEDDEDAEVEGPPVRAFKRATSHSALSAAAFSRSLFRWRSRRKRFRLPWCLGEESWFLRERGVSVTNILQCLQ